MNEVAAFSIVIEECDEEFRSVINGHNHHGKWEMWQSHWSKDKTTALRKAAALLSAMPTDFIAANANENQLAKDHPMVKAAR